MTQFETGFTMDASSIKFGPGMTAETGYEAARLGCTRVMVVTDGRLATLEPVETAVKSLKAAGIDAVVFDGARTEPTDASFQEAIVCALLRKTNAAPRVCSRRRRRSRAWFALSRLRPRA